MKQNKKELEKINKLKEDGLYLRRYKNQTYEMCLTAVRQNGLALQYVKNQTKEICLAAVHQNSRALKFVEEQTPEIVQAAVAQDEMAFRFIKFKKSTTHEETENKEFWLPVTWQVWDKVCVKAKTLEDAIEWVKQNIDELPLGTDPELIDGTYHLDDGDDGDASIEDTIRYFKGFYPSALDPVKQ